MNLSYLAMMLSIDLLVLEATGPLGVAATTELAEAARLTHLGDGAAGIDVRVVGGETGTVALRGGLAVAATPLADAGAARPWVVVPGIGAAGPAEMERRLASTDVHRAADWLAAAVAGGSAVAASCTGTFVAGLAGALDGRLVTTTWWLAGFFGRRFPACRVDADRMTVRDGPVLTAGSALGHVDLLLELIGDELGERVAGAVAARAAASRRPSQAPFRRTAGYPDLDPGLAEVERYVLDRLDRPVRLAELAAAVHLSARTLDRRMQAATGLSPMRFVQRIRVEAALDLLRDRSLSMAQIAAAVGVADAAALHHLIRRATGQPPQAFRPGAARS